MRGAQHTVGRVALIWYRRHPAGAFDFDFSIGPTVAADRSLCDRACKRWRRFSARAVEPGIVCVEAESLSTRRSLWRASTSALVGLQADSQNGYRSSAGGRKTKETLAPRIAPPFYLPVRRCRAASVVRPKTICDDSSAHSRDAPFSIGLAAKPKAGTATA